MDIEMHDILKEFSDISPLGKNSLFDEELSYKDIKNAYNSAVIDYKNLEEKPEPLPKYLSSRNIKDYRDDDLLASKKLYQLRNESEKRQASPSNISLLSLDTNSYHEEAFSLLENLENNEVIKKIYKLHNFNIGDKKNSGISTEEAAKIKYCLKQGRELFQAGHEGTSLVKPLNYFYSLTAYAYAVIVTKNPLRNKVAQIPGSHGIDFINDNISFKFGGDRKQGTFSDLHGAATNTVIYAADTDLSINRCERIKDYHEFSANISMGILLSMVPEIRDYFKIVSGHQSRCHPMFVSRTGDRNSLAWEWHIGDGIHRPESKKIEEAFPNCNIKERYGKYVIVISNNDLNHINPLVHSDIRNNLWFIENPIYPICLKNLDIHFLITNALSNIMRYSPERWGEILLNEVDGNVSLIIQRYLAALEANFPIYILREVSPYFPYIGNIENVHFQNQL